MCVCVCVCAARVSVSCMPAEYLALCVFYFSYLVVIVDRFVAFVLLCNINMYSIAVVDILTFNFVWCSGVQCTDYRTYNLHSVNRG